jgi:hypothetical protein
MPSFIRLGPTCTHHPGVITFVPPKTKGLDWSPDLHFRNWS